MEELAVFEGIWGFSCNGNFSCMSCQVYLQPLRFTVDKYWRDVCSKVLTGQLTSRILVIKVASDEHDIYVMLIVYQAPVYPRFKKPFRKHR